MISLAHVPRFRGAEDAVDELLRTGMIGQSGVINQFERSFAKWMGVNNAVTVSNGTMADMIALLILKHKNPERNEVILPALTFSAQLNAVIHAGLKPIFVDVGEDFQMNWMEARKKVNGDTLCAFPVHLMGRACDIREIDTYVIEDTCEAFGTRWMGKRCGTSGELGTFSFFVSHTITTGEGGMIVTRNDEYAELARRFRNHGKMANDRFHFDIVGLNAKMTSIQAAIGIESLKMADEAIEKRRRNYIHLGGAERAEEYVVPHGLPLMFPDEKARDDAMMFFKARGIECRNLFSSLPTQEPAYAFLGHKLGEFPVSEDIGRRCLYLPCHQGLNEEEINTLRGAIDAVWTPETEREEKIA